MRRLSIEPRWSWDAAEGIRNGFVVIADSRIADLTRERPTLDAERIALPDSLLLLQQAPFIERGRRIGCAPSPAPPCSRRRRWT